MKKAIILSILAIMLVTSVTAQEEPTIKPDSNFYGLKLAFENIQEKFQFSNQSKAEFHLNIAYKRFIEHEYIKAQYKNLNCSQYIGEIDNPKVMYADQNNIKQVQNCIAYTDSNRELSQKEDIEENKSDSFGQTISDLAKRKDFQAKKEAILSKRLAHIEEMESKKGVNLEGQRAKIEAKRQRIRENLIELEKAQKKEKNANSY